MAVKWKWNNNTGGGNVPANLENRVQTLENEVVKKTGDQSIAGNKTFTQPLTVATPTANTNAATKEYVDSKIRTRVLDIQNRQSNTYTIEPVQGYQILSVMVGRKRNSDGFYFFQYHTNLNFQVFLHSDGRYQIYTQGPVSDFAGEYKIIVVERKL